MPDQPTHHSGGTNSENTDTNTPALAAADVRLLEFEQQWPTPTAAKEGAIVTVLRMSRVRYHQRLRLLVEDPRALAAFPDVCTGYLASLERGRARRAARSVGRVEVPDAL